MNANAVVYMLSKERKEAINRNQTLINRRFNIEKTSKEPAKHQKNINSLNAE